MRLVLEIFTVCAAGADVTCTFLSHCWDEFILDFRRPENIFSFSIIPSQAIEIFPCYKPIHSTQMNSTNQHKMSRHEPPWYLPIYPGTFWFQHGKGYDIALLYPTHNKVVGGYIGFTLSVRPSVRPSRIPCPLCGDTAVADTSYQATSESVSRVKLFANFEFLAIFWNV